MDTTDSAYGDKLVRLDTFDTAVAVDPSAEDDAKRRFMTLILQTAHRNNGNIGHVLRATNTSGEVFAVKLLKDNAILSGQAPDRSAEQAAAHLANTAALFEEYRHLCTVSHLRGFPRVYGYGSCEDDPLILMEWVEGTSLKQALPLLPHDAMTRRRFIIGGVVAAVAGLGVIGAATHGFGIPDYLDGIRGSLDDYTWDQLQEISLKIKAAETRSEAREIAKRYHLLDDNGHIPYPCTKRVRLTNGLHVGAQLVGIRHDDLLDGTGKAGLTFMFDAGIAERDAAVQPLSAGWADCELREWLDGDGLKLLPNELRALIKSVKKISNNVGAARSASCLSELPATLWLPAMVELCGVQPPESFTEGFHYLADIYNGEGKEYQLFRELKVSPYTTNETLVRQWKGKDTCWWERTASPDTSESEGTLYMNRVGRDGDVFTYATPAEKPNKRTCVIPGFCI